jgi:precorrin-6Y C5,15-methyltransferase (decarboxylating)
MSVWLTIVGIGEDGLAGLGDAARRAVAEARILVGGKRHLALVSESGQERIVWPTPFGAAFDLVLARRGTPLCILASGDPMWFGIGASLSRIVPAEEMRVLSGVSSFALAAARLVWPLQDVTTLSVHGRPVEALQPFVHPGARLLILSENGETPAAIAALLTQRGFGASRLTVFEHLAGPAERKFDGSARDWRHGRCADLNLVAADCIADGDAVLLSTLAGLPDDAFLNDGQITKRDVRAATLAHLAPLPGELLWDVGAGCGSIGIEWMRAHPSCRAIAIETRADRRALIEQNRKRLGVPGLRLVAGSAPHALAGLDPPSAVFIGGGVSVTGVLEASWDALQPGGRLVANAVTLQAEAILTEWRRKTDGALTRLSVAQAGPLGNFDGWRTAMPVTLLAATK